MFKNMFAPENFTAYTFVHFRTLNHRLPIQRGRVMNLPYEDRLCNKCSSADIGEEFHYAFSFFSFFFFFFFLVFFFFFLLNPEERRKKSPFYCKNANVNRFSQSFLQ